MGQDILIRKHLAGNDHVPEVPQLSWGSTDPLDGLVGGSLPQVSLAGRTAAGEAAMGNTGAARDSHPASAQPPPEDFDPTTCLSVETSAGTLWLQGDSVLYGCPECRAPMSIRLWLMIADCWHCGTSVELTEEQQRAVNRLLDRAAEPTHELATETPTAPVRSPVLPRAPRPPRSGKRPLSSAATAPRRRTQPRPMTRFQLGPAWLVSLLLHLLLLLLLALFTFQNQEAWETITLSSFVSTEDVEGGDVRDVDLEQPLQDDLPRPSAQEFDEQEMRDVLARADQDARELQIDPDPTVVPPDLREVRERIAGEPGSRPIFAARDPRLRAEMVTREGGTLLTEAAVSRGLRWLAEHQNNDGSWSLSQYERSDRPNQTGDIAGTSLALLPFLGAGQTHEYGRYKETVAKGLRWLVNHQASDGDLRDGVNDVRGMYAHGQGAIVLVEALAMTGDERFRDPVQRAIDFIVAAQHEQGGWRYRPGEAGDTSVLGWQLMALQSARAPGTGLRVPDASLKLAAYYLDLASTNNESRYRYQPRRGEAPTPSMTAEALLCRVYLGWTRDDPRLQAGMRWLRERHPPQRSEGNLYYWYYATQLFHHLGGEPWDEWNVEMRDQLVNTQEKRGRHAGSWAPEKFEFGSQGGRIYTTSLSVCILEVYYRHLPLFKQLNLE